MPHFSSTFRHAEVARRPGFPRAVLTLLLVLSMLLGQWVGTVHRIDHAGASSTPGIESVAETDSRYGIWHSCAAFDAATLGDVFASIPAPLLPAFFAGLPPARQLFTSRARSTTCPFSSRAPPAI
jgi:hypothetical protein